MSNKNQNFKNNQDIKIINVLLETFGLNNLTDERSFTKEYMKDINTVTKINTLIPTLSEYYLPCKCKIYLNDITEKKAITILRQFIRNFNYKVISFEKSVKGKKIMIYRLMLENKDLLYPKNNNIKDNRKYIISFDT